MLLDLKPVEGLISLSSFCCLLRKLHKFSLAQTEIPGPCFGPPFLLCIKLWTVFTAVVDSQMCQHA